MSFKCGLKTVTYFDEKKTLHGTVDSEFILMMFFRPAVLLAELVMKHKQHNISDYVRIGTRSHDQFLLQYIVPKIAYSMYCQYSN